MVFSASVWSILGSLIEKVLMLATYVIISREVGTTEFGYLVLALLIIELMGYVAGFGVGGNIVRKQSLSDGFMSSIYYFVCYVSIALVILMLVLVAPLSYFFISLDFTTLILSLAIYPALTTLSRFYLAILQRDMRFKEIAFRTAAISVFSGVIGVLLALNGFGVFSLIVARYVYSIMDLVILKYLTGFSTQVAPDRKNLQDVWSFGWKISVSELLNFSSSRIYEIFVIGFFGPAYLAILDVGNKFLMTFYRVVLTPLYSVCLSYISKKDNPIAAYFYFSRIVNFFVVPVSAAMGVMSTPMVLMFFGEKWRDSADVLMLLSIGGVVQVTAWFLPGLMIRLGRPDIVLLIQAIKVIVLLVFGLIGIVLVDDFNSFIMILLVGFITSSILCFIYVSNAMAFPIFQYFIMVIKCILLYITCYFSFEYIYNFVDGVLRPVDSIAGFYRSLVGFLTIGLVIALSSSVMAYFIYSREQAVTCDKKGLY